MEILFKDLLPNDIKKFVEEVSSKTKGYEVYLGGGLLRDLYFNHLNGFGSKDCWLHYFMGEGIDNQPMKPKDIDLFFIPINDYYEKQLPILPKMYINYDVPAKDIPNVRENVEHVRGLFMKDLSVRDIQFIVYDKPLSIVELAEDMDCNLNQVMYHPLSGCQYTSKEFIISHKDKVIKMLHEFEPERMFSRIQRMMKKFPNYTVEHNISSEDWEYLCYKLEADKKSKKRGSNHAGSFIEE